MVEPTWLLMSSPTMGTPASANRRAHSRSLAMNTGMQFTSPTPASRAASAPRRFGTSAEYSTSSKLSRA